jgi:hypothetical protein
MIGGERTSMAMKRAVAVSPSGGSTSREVRVAIAATKMVPLLGLAFFSLPSVTVASTSLL